MSSRSIISIKLFITAYTACQEFMHMQSGNFFNPTTGGARSIHFMLCQDVLVSDAEIFNQNFLLLCAIIPRFMSPLAFFSNIILDIITNA